MVKNILIPICAMLGRLMPKRPFEPLPSPPSVPQRKRWPIGPRPLSNPELAAKAIEVIFRAEYGHKHGRSSPSPTETKAAWDELEKISLPLAGRTRTCIFREFSLPRCPPNMGADVWFAREWIKQDQQIDETINEIWKGLPGLKFWPRLDDVMARKVEQRLGGLPPIVIRKGGPIAKREVHCRSAIRTKAHPRGRVLIMQMYEYGENGPLEILDRPGGWLSRKTVERSGWKISEGCIASGAGGSGGKRSVEDGGGDRGGGDDSGGGAPTDNTPSPPLMKP